MKDFPLFRFVKERGDLEKEYARGLRKLVARWVNIEEFGLLIVNQKRNWVLEIKKMQINTFCKVYSKRQKERCSAWVFTDILLQVINRDNCVQIQIQIHMRIYNCNQAPSMWGWLPSWSAWVAFRITWYVMISWCMNWFSD